MTPPNKRSKKLDLVTPEEYGQKLTVVLTNEILRLIDHDEPKFSAGWATTVRLNVIASLVSTVIYRCLSVEPKPAKDLEEATDLAHSGYKAIKEAVEQAVAVAFQSAFQTHSGQSADFFVQITPIPEPTNTLPC